MKRKAGLLLALIVMALKSFSQSCNCEAEFNNIKVFMEKNYAGFKDKKELMTKAGYEKMVNEYHNYSEVRTPAKNVF